MYKINKYVNRKLGKYNIFNHNIVFQFPNHLYMNHNHLVHYINYFVVEVMMDLIDQKDLLRDNINFALKKKYSIEIHYSDEIDLKKNRVIWKYPPYIVKNMLTDKIIDELINYFKNFNNYILVMHLIGNQIKHKVPINIPY